MRVIINGVEYIADGSVTLTPVVAPVPTPDPVPDPTPEPTPTPTPEPTPTPTPEGVVFFDGFDYIADRDDANIIQVFQSHGWSHCKTYQSGQTGARGYMYTTDTVPGHEGPFPGGGSRVLCMEARPALYGSQTDFYLQLGNGEDASYENFIPGDVWVQYWFYIADTPEFPSRFDTRNKMLYPCRGPYPCNRLMWLTSIEPSSYIPHWNDYGVPTSSVYSTAYLNPGMATVSHAGEESYNYGKAGQTTLTPSLTPNNWHLVKLHFNTASQNGAYEAWIKSSGTQDFVKVADFVSGQNGFVWDIPPENQGGHRVLRFPTTIGSGIADRPRWDAWMYMDDFCIARSEADLPGY